ncbi:glycosyltransferase family 1 protein, partial [archaeon]|nr:glycosyltransferase family 1 protein [archaeon]
MKNRKIFLHGSYIGTTGYNQHTRDFVRHLSDLTDIKVRNFTIGKTWVGMSESPHSNEPYFNEKDEKVLYEQILWNENKNRSNHKIYKSELKEFEPDVDIVLCETNHHLFYDNYDGPRIAYNVWESTLQPPHYFERLKYFDEFWVPSKWQKECTVKQGYPEDKIKVVPEGVDVNTFFPEDVSHEMTSDGRFKFFLAGRWDYRKSTKEVIESFLKTFDKNEEVDLIVSIDNPFSNDGLNTTEERLDYYNFTDDRIKVLHFPPREDYIKLLKSSHVFLSCARSEGWNLPLIESMACGTPSIYSNCSGQLEFAEGRGLPVKISHELP